MCFTTPSSLRVTIEAVQAQADDNGLNRCEYTVEPDFERLCEDLCSYWGSSMEYTSVSTSDMIQSAMSPALGNGEEAQSLVCQSFTLWWRISQSDRSHLTSCELPTILAITSAAFCCCDRMCAAAGQLVIELFPHTHWKSCVVDRACRADSPRRGPERQLQR